MLIKCCLINLVYLKVRPLFLELSFMLYPFKLCLHLKRLIKSALMYFRGKLLHLGVNLLVGSLPDDDNVDFLINFQTQIFDLDVNEHMTLVHLI